ncbi:hypothetical protein ACJJTC_014441 [Scirpophaga incertulas]
MAVTVHMSRTCLRCSILAFIMASKRRKILSIHAANTCTSEIINDWLQEDEIDTDVGLTANVVPEPHSDDDDADFILSDHDTRSECSDSEELDMDSNTEILPTFKWSTTPPSRNV